MLIRCFVLLALFISSIGFSQESTYDLDDALIVSIVANDSDGVFECVEDKVYLNPKKIIPTNQGLFLCLNDQDYVVLPSLCSDEQGCYIQLTRIRARKEIISPLGGAKAPWLNYRKGGSISNTISFTII